MVNNRLCLKTFVMALLLGFMIVGVIEAQTNWLDEAQTDRFNESQIDNRLNGIWVHRDGSEFRVSNENYEMWGGEITAIKGTYTIDNGKITLTPTHFYGSPTDDIILGAGWYSYYELLYAVRNINSDRRQLLRDYLYYLFTPETFNYSLNDDVLTIGRSVYIKR